MALPYAGCADTGAAAAAVAVKMVALERENRMRWVTCQARLSAHCRPLQLAAGATRS